MASTWFIFRHGNRRPRFIKPLVMMMIMIMIMIIIIITIIKHHM